MPKTKSHRRIQWAMAKRWEPFSNAATGRIPESPDQELQSRIFVAPEQPVVLDGSPIHTPNSGIRNELLGQVGTAHDSEEQNPSQEEGSGLRQKPAELVLTTPTENTICVQATPHTHNQEIQTTCTRTQSEQEKQLRLSSLRRKLENVCPSLKIDILCISACHMTLETWGTFSPPVITPQPGKHNRSWMLNYPALSFMMNGQLFSKYSHIMNMLGLQHMSEKHWRNTVEWLEGYVTGLMESSCEAVREAIRRRGDQHSWVASYDGFYLTRGHHSNNASATLHDYESGQIAWVEHRTKKGRSHNWEGTSAGAESDMLDEVLRKAKNAGFTVAEIVTDKDSSVKSVYLEHFPEGRVTFCSNHCTKTLHKDLQVIKHNKCRCRTSGLGPCKRMPETFITSCKKHLRQVISSLTESSNPYPKLSAALLNFHSHYCLDDHTSQWCQHEKERDGTPYRSKNWFTCPAQAEPFKELMQGMSSRPQDYISTRGRLTTNTVEGYHGLALLYREKRIDLGHAHYVCKTNMSVCHKNLGPIWKVLCCSLMGVDMPITALEAILAEQQTWDNERQRRTGEEFALKRNKQKTAKNARYEAEKALMEERRSVGITTGAYVGRGQGESVDADPEMDEDLASDDSDGDGEGGDGEGSAEGAGDDDQETSIPLLFFFDIETTGLSIYNDVIIDIGAKLVNVPEPKTYQSLVRTSKSISEKVVKLTGIHNTDLLGERPLSVVLREFFTWVNNTTKQHALLTGKEHHPVAHNGAKFDFPILLAEIDRRKENMSTSILCQHHIHFADTLPLLRKAKKEGCTALKDVKKFGLSALCETFLPGCQFNAHRALPDVEAMEALFGVLSLNALLPFLAITTPQQQIQLWTEQKKKRDGIQSLVHSFGKKITKAHAQQLMKLGISFAALEKWKGKAEGRKKFDDLLKKKKIKSKLLRERLSQFFFK